MGDHLEGLVGRFLHPQIGPDGKGRRRCDTARERDDDVHHLEARGFERPHLLEILEARAAQHLLEVFGASPLQHRFEQQPVAGRRRGVGCTDATDHDAEGFGVERLPHEIDVRVVMATHAAAL